MKRSLELTSCETKTVHGNTKKNCIIHISTKMHPVILLNCCWFLKSNCWRNYWRSCWCPQQSVQEMTKWLLLQNKPTPVSPAHLVSVWLTQEEANPSEISLAAQCSSGRTFSITMVVTVKLSHAWVRNNLTLSQQIFFSGKKIKMIHDWCLPTSTHVADGLQAFLN